MFTGAHLDSKGAFANNKLPSFIQESSMGKYGNNAMRSPSKFNAAAFGLATDLANLPS